VANAEISRVSIHASVRSAAAIPTPDHVLTKVESSRIVATDCSSSHILVVDDEVLRFHESAAASSTVSAVQVRRPVYSSSVGKWRHHAERLAPLRARLKQEIPEAELA
jgi:hypothetical protein